MTSPTNEQQRVDVLAVLADAALTLSKVAQIQMDERAEEMRQARAAVAELIEAAQPFRKDPNPCGRGDHFTNGQFVTLGQIRRLDAAMKAINAPDLCNCGSLQYPHATGTPGCHFYCKCDVCRKPVIGPACGFPDVLCKSCADPALANVGAQP